MSIITITQDLDFIAEYDINDYVVIFKNENGDTIYTETVTYLQNVINIPTPPINVGRTFTSWDIDPTLPITQDTVITAQYDDNIYTVNFLGFNNEVIVSRQVIHGQTAIAPDDPTYISHNFLGWDDTGINITSDKDIESLWDIKKYNLRFYKKDGVTIHLTMTDVHYGTEIDLRTIAAPGEIGHTFSKWEIK